MAILRYVISVIVFLLSLPSVANYSAVPTQYLCSNKYASTMSAACTAYAQQYNGACGTYTGTLNGTICTATSSLGGNCNNVSAPNCSPQGLTCPNGGTLSGTTCVHTCPDGTFETTTGACVPACPSGETQNPDGSCVSACEAASQAAPTYGWYKSTVGGPTIEGTYCNGQCMVAFNPAPTGTAYNNGKEKVQRYQLVVTAAPCQAANIPTQTPAANAPPEPPKSPVCLPTEGVLTTTSGTIACVPPGVPTQSVPIVTKDSQKTAFPDGSQKTVETTYTKDPVSQVQDTRQTTTITPATGGGAGAAGTPGTTSGTGTSGTSSGGNPAPGESSGADLCQKNPGLQICKGGMNEEATQKEVRDGVNKVRDAVSAEGFDPTEHIKDGALSNETKGFVEEKVSGVVTDLNKFGTASDLASGSYSSFKDQMGNWIDTIPSSGCQPFVVRVGAWTWNHDHCDVAAKVSSIGAFCMWVMLAFGIFAAVTKERN